MIDVTDVCQAGHWATWSSCVSDIGRDSTTTATRLVAGQQGGCGKIKRDPGRDEEEEEKSSHHL